MSLLLNELSAYYDSILCFVPGKTGSYLRYLFLKRRFRSCGNNIEISQGVFFKGFENIDLGSNISFGIFNKIFAESQTEDAKIKIGSNVSLNCNVMINADVKGDIIIEDNVIIGPNVVIRASGHKYSNVVIPIREQGHHKGKIVIKNGAWIGANVVILPNVTVNSGAIVGAGAVITKDVGEFEIAGGVPAKKIGSRLKKYP